MALRVVSHETMNSMLEKEIKKTLERYPEVSYEDDKIAVKRQAFESILISQENQGWKFVNETQHGFVFEVNSEKKNNLHFLLKMYDNTTIGVFSSLGEAQDHCGKTAVSYQEIFLYQNDTVSTIYYRRKNEDSWFIY